MLSDWAYREYEKVRKGSHNSVEDRVLRSVWFGGGDFLFEELNKNVLGVVLTLQK